ncbi:ADP-ribosylation factor family, putative [Trypanosoma equiperdum]|uniref:PH domain-containing protein n=2 Tax=Trypanozoon TaxID=39700 RepID=Q38A08_TRYB2|nr:hypothetical protein, conserved [Trypanosoma brucei brucei TREU927]EAN78362.1 hypothetical protein, conserved [Trypanosoma brucei brucei TREU927]SCU69282.1 ADP-ribosylation factor family, putative [Trypanosoma equiperdum]
MEQAQRPPDNVMGVMRCAVERGRKSFVAYKKRFWVVDETQGRLEVYKNDQEPVPLDRFCASEVRGVIISGDRQNKFYGLVLQLRRGQNIKLRLSSLAERDRWYAAITRLIERCSTYNRDYNLLRVAQRRTLVAGRLLGVNITLAVARLSDIPDDLLQYLVEAVDVAIDTISAAVHAYGGDVEVPRRYTITVEAGQDRIDTGPQYDPTTGSLLLNVWISRDVTGNVRFNVADSAEVMKMTQSHVWREPRIEGWITTNPSCVAVCREIGEMLGSRNFSFSFQWGQNLRDTERVEQYLHQYVHEDFLRAIHRNIVEVVEDFRRSDTDADDSCYLKYIGDFVSGIAIVLDESTVNAGKPPLLRVTTTVEYQRRCRHAVVLKSKYFEVYRTQRVLTKSLRLQLVEVILLADLSKRLSDSKTALTQAIGGNECVRIIWVNLFRSFASVGAQLPQFKLSDVVTSITNTYLTRLESLQQLGSLELPYAGVKPLYASLFSNVTTLVVDFVPFKEDDVSQLPEPKVHDGILTDYIVCCTAAQQRAMMNFICSRRGVPQIDRAYVLLNGLFAFPSMPATTFKEWCEKQAFNGVEGYSGANDDDSSSRSSGGSDDLGDAVAFERNAEAQVLDLHRVVSTIYDSQGAAVHLKIGADSIRDAIEALEQAFDGRQIRKHDLVRVLTANLRRLRAIYSHAVGGEVMTRLDLDAAGRLLRSLCEYKESEQGLDELLQRCAQQRQQAVRLGSSDSVPQERRSLSCSASESIYDFQCVSQVALNYVLPREVKLARKAWRVGLVAGLQDVGKTLILNSLHGVIQPTFPTIGLSQRVIAFEEWVFAMHELGGRESFRENWRYYVERMEEVDFLFFVVDSMNKRAFKYASNYLREITNYFVNTPLVVLFNNVRVGVRGVSLLDHLSGAVKLDKIKKRQPERFIIVGTCDITVVSSSHRTIPPTLLETMQRLGEYLRQVSPPERTPSEPKKGSGVEYTTT